jgi:hypothetical protein
VFRIPPKRDTFRCLRWPCSVIDSKNLRSSASRFRGVNGCPRAWSRRTRRQPALGLAPHPTCQRANFGSPS